MSNEQVREHNKRVKEVEMMDEAAKTFVTRSTYRTTVADVRNKEAAQEQLKHLR